MAEMKDSGIHAIGRIPKEWNVVRTKYLSNISIGLVTTMTENYVEKEEGVPLIRNGNIRCNKIDVNGMVFLDKRFAEKNKHRQLHTGQIATVHTGDVGTSIVIPEEYDGGLGFATIQSTPYKGVSSEFLCWFYNSAAFKNQCIECSTGDGRQNLNLYDFVDLFVAIPKYDLQSKIASFLDKKCAEIDSLHTDIEKQIETLEEYKKSIITEAVTKGLDPDVEMKDSGIEWVGMIPKHWNVTKFKYICSVKTNLVNVKKYQEYPQISPDNIEKDSGILLNYSTVSEAGVISDNHLFFKGQILYSKIRPKLNKATIAPFNGLCSADMYPIETNENTMFVLYMILSQYFLNQVSLVTEDRVKMPKINQEELGVIKIVLPDNINEQEKIVLYLHQKCQDISKAIEEKKEQLETLEQYKKSLIYEYVTGKKEVQ